MTTCKVRRALYQRITLGMFRVGSFKAALEAFAARQNKPSVAERLEKVERLYRVMLEDHVTLMHQMEACEDRLRRLEVVK